MDRNLRNFILRVIVVLAVTMLAAGCVYYNAFFNAKKNFELAENQSRAIGNKKGSSRFGAGYRTYEEAIERFSKIIDRHPNSKWVDDAYYYIGLCYFRMGEFTKSERAFDEIITNYPESKFVEESKYWIALCRVNLRELVAGREMLYRLALNAESKRWRAEAWTELGNLFYENEEYDSAAQAYLTVADEYGSEGIAKGIRYHAGDALMLAGRQDEALEQFYRTLAEKPTNELVYRARIRMSDAFFERQEIDSGLAILDELASNDLFFDSLGVVQLKIGWGKEQAGAYEEAIGIYTDVTETFPKTVWAAEAYYRIGYIHQKYYFDFPLAREFYALSKKEKSGSQFAKKAIALSVVLATIEEYQKQIAEAYADTADTARADSLGLADSSIADTTAENVSADTTESATISQAIAGEPTSADTEVDSVVDTTIIETAAPEAEPIVDIPPDLSPSEMTVEQVTAQLAKIADSIYDSGADIVPDSLATPDSAIIADTTVVLDSIFAETPVDSTDKAIIDTTETISAIDSSISEMAGAEIDTIPRVDTLLAIDTTVAVDTTYLVDTLLSVVPPSGKPKPSTEPSAAETTSTGGVLRTGSTAIGLRDTLGGRAAVDTNIDSILARDSVSTDTVGAADTVVTGDSLSVAESPKQYVELPPDETAWIIDSLIYQNILSSFGTLLKIDTTVIIDTTIFIDTTTTIDTLLSSGDQIAPLDSTIALDSALALDTTRTIDTTLAIDTAVVIDSMLTLDSTFTVDTSLALDTTYGFDTSLVVDTVRIVVPKTAWNDVHNHDTTVGFDTSLIVDTTRIIDSLAAARGLVPADPVMIFDTLIIVDTTVSVDSGLIAGLAYLYDTTLALDTILTVDTTMTLDSNQAARDLAVAERLAEEAERARLAEREKLATAYFNVAQALHLTLEANDSALSYYDTLIVKFPESGYTPRALFATGSILEEMGDSAAAARRYRRVLDDYGRTDFAGAAIARLGLAQTAADTGYPGAYYRQAEQLYLQDDNPQAAREKFAWIAREFPTSIYAPQAAYAAVMMAEDMQTDREDSSLVELYQEYIDSFPNTKFAAAAKARLGGNVPKQEQRKRAVMVEASSGDDDIDSALAAIQAEQGDTTIIRLPKAPTARNRIKTLGEFIYPESELGQNPWKGKVVFKIWIDFTGEIGEYELVESSNVPDIDLAATAAVEGTFFNPDSIPAESLNIWYQYEVRVIPPAQDKENIFDDPNFIK